MPQGLAVGTHVRDILESHELIQETSESPASLITLDAKNKMHCVSMLNFDENPCCSKSRFPANISISLVKETRVRLSK